MPLHLAFPLASGVLFVFAMLLLKRASALGAGAWRATFVANIVTAIAFLVLLPLGGPGQPWTMLWQPAVAGAVFLVGQMLTFLALDRGDVSVATPVLGLKIVFVATLTALVLQEVVSLRLWIAVLTATVGIVLLNRTDGSSARRVGFTVLAAGGSAAAFAVFDVLVAKWAPAWGAGRFLPIMLGCLAVWSLGLVPLFRHPLRDIPAVAWGPLLSGAGLLALQALILITTIANFGDVTQINIVYAARGLWSVVLVWWIGHWFANREREQGGRTLAWRMSGAALVLAAIALIVT